MSVHHSTNNQKGGIFMFCFNCGKELDDNAVVCPNCGVPQKKTNDKDGEGVLLYFLYGLLGFFVPTAGIVLYLVWSNDKDKTHVFAAKSAAIGTLLAVVIGLLVSIFSVYSFGHIFSLMF